MEPPPGCPGAAETKEVKVMRKFFALSLMALLALTLTLAVVSCGGQQAEPPAATETAPAMDNTMMADTSMMHSDSMATDTSMGGH
jgi:hypothetical protein